MGMTLGQQAAKLQETVQTITPAAARRRINVAYLRLSERNPWQHLLKRFTLQTEALYNTGTIALTTATTAVVLTDGAWVVSWGTAPSMRRMAVAGRNEPYDVTIFPTTTSATLADPLVGASIVDGAYTLFRDTYALPADCGYADLLAIYDPSQQGQYQDRGRLYFYNQSVFLKTRAAQPTSTGIPWCFTVVQQTSETPPRPQIQLWPAPTDIRSYHGWYFRRPAFLTSDADYFDWPSKFDDMLWLTAAIEHYETPQFRSLSNLAILKPKLAELFMQMKKEMDGQSAMEFAVQGTRERGGYGFNPTFFGSTITGSIDHG